MAHIMANAKKTVEKPKAAPVPEPEVLGFEEEENEEESASPGKQVEEDGEDSEEEIEPMIDPNEIPPWALTLLADAGVKAPPGRMVWYLKFRSSTTHAPQKGDRICALWSISDTEEDQAAMRASGKPASIFQKECAKLMIRAFDGKKALWGGGAHDGNARVFWEDIGPKNRQQIVNLYVKMHRLTNDEAVDFFTKCIAGVPAML